MGLLETLGLSPRVPREFTDWLDATLGRWPRGWEESLDKLIELDDGIKAFHAQHGIRAFRKAIWHYVKAVEPAVLEENVRDFGDSRRMGMIVGAYMQARGPVPRGILLLRDTLRDVGKLGPPTTSSVAPLPTDDQAILLARAVRQFDEAPDLPATAVSAVGGTADQVWWEMVFVRLHAVHFLLEVELRGQEHRHSLFQRILKALVTTYDNREVATTAWLAQAIADYDSQTGRLDGDMDHLVKVVGACFARRLKSEVPVVSTLGEELWRQSYSLAYPLVRKG